MADNSTIEFMEISGCDEEAAKNYLEMAGGDINLAYSFFLEFSVGEEELKCAKVEGRNENRRQRSKKNNTNFSSPSSSSFRQISSSCLKKNDGADILRDADQSFQQTLISESESAHLMLHLQKETKQKKTLQNSFLEVLSKEADKSNEGDKAFRQLFSLPKNVVCNLSLYECRMLAKENGKFVLINIQKMDNFESLKLNRDVWNNEIIRDLINDFFIFWQRNENDEEGMLFQKLYRVTSFPHVSVLHGRTGRQIKVWDFKKISDAINAQSELFEFVELQQQKEEQRRIELVATEKTKKKIGFEESNNEETKRCKIQISEAAFLHDRKNTNDNFSKATYINDDGLCCNDEESQPFNSIKAIDQCNITSLNCNIEDCVKKNENSTAISSSLCSSSNLSNPVISVSSSSSSSSTESVSSTYKNINLELAEMRRLREIRLKNKN